MQELQDFEYFKKYQLANINFNTGVIDTKFQGKNQFGKTKTIIRKNVGSVNEDGYIRLWCNNTLRMKHRLIYWLYHNELPDEIDHIDGVRDNNSINNLRNVSRQEQLQNIKYPSKNRKQFTEDEIHFICKLLSEGISQNIIAKQFNCARTTISSINTKHSHKKISDLYF